jgi:hypothetical protein
MYTNIWILCSNWAFVGPKDRLPNGIISILLKTYWPGFYKVNPDNPRCQLRKLALRWEDYLAVREGTFGTCAAAVIAKFWVGLYFYGVPFIVHDPTVLTREFRSM